MNDESKSNFAITRKSRTRSPNYPAVSLETAIARAQTLWDKEQRHETGVDVVAQHWNYNNFAVSGAMQTLAALRSFGLVDVTGKANDRKVRLSDRALDIILLEQDDPKRRSAIRAAVESPPLYAELLEKRTHGSLPSDANLRSYLIRDRGFNSKAVDGFLSDFRASIAFTEEQIGDTLSSSDNGDPDEVEKKKASTTVDRGGLEAMMSQMFKTGEKTTPKTGSNQKAIAMKKEVSIIGDHEAAICWPSEMTASQFEDFEYWLNGVLRKVKRGVSGGSQEQPDVEPSD